MAAHLKLKLMVEVAHPKFLVFLSILTENRMVAAHLKLKVEMVEMANQVLMVMSHLELKLKIKNVKVKVEMSHQVLMVMSHLRIKFGVFPLKLRKMDQMWSRLPPFASC